MWLLGTGIRSAQSQPRSLSLAAEGHATHEALFRHRDTRHRVLAQSVLGLLYACRLQAGNPPDGRGGRLERRAYLEEPKVGREVAEACFPSVTLDCSRGTHQPSNVFVERCRPSAPFSFEGFGSTIRFEEPQLPSNVLVELTRRTLLPVRAVFVRGIWFDD